jgi:hypothetical protein
VVLVARSNRLEALRPLAPALLETLLQVRPGEVQRVTGEAEREGRGAG